MYRLISNIFPRKSRDKFALLLRYADIKAVPDKFLGFLITFGLLFSILISILFKLLFNLPFIIYLIVSFVVIGFILYFPIILKADKKSRVIEEHLPDALQLMSGNLRAGITIDHALLLSTRPEFGVLNKEINLVGKQITMGKSISDALLSMTKRVRSKTFEKTILLIVSGLKSGGELASLLEESAEDLISKRIVDKKVRSSVNMYVIFIFIAIAFGAPLLFGLSSYLIGVLTETLGQVELPQTSQVSIPFTISSGPPTLNQEFVTNFSLIFLLTSVILGSLIIGLISKGKEKYGVKYIIPLLILSIGLFYLVRLLINNFLGGLFAFT